MRTFTLASCLAVAEALRIMDFGGTTFNTMFDSVIASYDEDGDGQLDSGEYMRLLEFLDEDQSLTPREMGTALQNYIEMEWSGNNPS